MISQDASGTGRFLGGLILLVVGLFALLFAVSLIVGSVSIWFPAALVGLAGFGTVRLLARRDLGRPRVVASFLDGATRDGGGLRVVVDEQAVSRYEQVRNSAVLVAAFGAALALAAQAWFSGGPSGFIVQLAVIVGVALAAALLYLMWRYLAVSGVSGKVRHRAEAVNAECAVLDGELSRLSALAGEELEIEFPLEEHLREVRDSLESRPEELLAQPGTARGVLERTRAGIVEDLRGLEAALGQLEDAEAVHARASRAVAASPSLLAAADELHAEIHRSRNLLLPAREWQSFAEAMALYSGELERLLELAQTDGHHEESGSGHGTSPDPATADPYRVMGADPTMETSQIQKLYRKLSTVYHPDAGLVADGEKFKEINHAWDTIRAERGHA